ncbi:MAG: hypothetical protein H7338_21585 [Candidatus Sericytochromatia bacterium]|nr:hypothetical protein [Candidatus Sericytochromatia bacterium]
MTFFGGAITLTRRTLIILGLLATLPLTAGKSSCSTSTTGLDGKTTTTTTTTNTGSDATASVANAAATKVKPTAAKQTGQIVTGAGFTLAVPANWKVFETPAKAGQFTGLVGYGIEASAAANSGVNVMKGTIPYVNTDTDRRLVWDAVAASNKADYGAEGEFGANYESNDGFYYTAKDKTGNEFQGFTTFIRKGENLYFIDVYGGTKTMNEEEAYGIIGSFELK